MVSEKDAVEIISCLEARGIEVLIDGGWGVDALLGVTTRFHNDIDIFIEYIDRIKTFEIFVGMGFDEIEMDYTTPNHVVLQDAIGRIIDLHLFSYLANGQLSFEGETYPSDIFNFRGKIGGKIVKCVTPKYQVMFHCGYEHDHNDEWDVRLICKKFNLPIPKEYQSKK